MKLTLSHADLELALIESLRAKGMNAFVPGLASVEFSFKRGTKELICELDTEAKPEAVAEVAPKSSKASAATPTVTTSASVAETQAAAPAEAVSEPVEQLADAVADAEPVLETAGGEDDNLFG